MNKFLFDKIKSFLNTKLFFPSSDASIIYGIISYATKIKIISDSCIEL